MSGTIQIGRLALGPPTSAAVEPIGDPVGELGGSVVPAPRTPMQMQLDLNTILSGSSALTQAQTVRRQLRSLLNNTPLKQQCFIYFQYTDDTELNGWLIPAPSTLNSPDAVAWKAVGLWQTSSAGWYMAGKKRGMREARSVWMKDLRTGLFERDTLEWILSADFAYLPALQLTALPAGAAQIMNNVSGATNAAVALPAGHDGGSCSLCQSQTDLSVLSFERPDSSMTLSDVVVYDRRGNRGPFGPSPWWDSGWPYRQPFTIDHTKVGAQLTNFPVTVDVTNNAAIAAQAQPSLGDLRFVDAANNPLPYEIETVGGQEFLPEGGATWWDSTNTICGRINKNRVYASYASKLNEIIVASLDIDQQTQSYSALVAASTPTSYLRLNDTSGTIAVDQQGANNGTYVNSPGLGGQRLITNPSAPGSVKFVPGASQEVTIPGPTLGATATSPFTTELWFAWSSGSTIMRDHTTLNGWIIGLDSSGTFAVRIAGTTINTSQTTVAVQNGQRHHLVVTYDGAGNVLVYLDGAQVASQGAITPNASNGVWHVGRNGSTASYSDVVAAEIAFYPSALSAAAVLSHFQVGVGGVQSFVLHGVGFDSAMDDHDAANLIMLPSGKLMAFYYRHANSDLLIYYRTSTNAEDISAWGAEQTFSVPVGGIDYPRPVYLADEGLLYLFYKGSYNSLSAATTFITSTDFGATWSSPQVLFNNGFSNRPFVNMWDDGNGRIDFAMTEAGPIHDSLGSVLTSMYHCYYVGGNLYKSDGTLICAMTAAGLGSNGLTVNAVNLTQFYNSAENGAAWGWDIVRDANTGIVTVVFATFPGAVAGTIGSVTSHIYHYAQCINGQWQHQAICQGTYGGIPVSAGEQAYSGGMAILKENPSVVYVSRQQDATTGGVGTWELERWTTPDGGNSWSSIPITQGSSAQRQKQIRPTCPRNRNSLTRTPPEVLWMMGKYGDYGFPLGYDTVVMMYPAVLPVTKLARVEVGQLSPVADETFYMYWGNSSVKSIAQNVYDSNTLAHLANLDRQFGGGTGDYSGLDAIDLTNLTGLTVEARVTITRQAPGGTTDYICSNWQAGGKASFLIRATTGSSTQIDGFVQASGGQVGGSFTVPGGIAIRDGLPHRIAMTYDTVNGLQLWVDGLKSATTFAANGAMHSAASTATLSYAFSPHDLPPAPTPGTIQDTRVSNVVRSNGWITTTYHDRKDLIKTASQSSYDESPFPANQQTAYGWEEVYGLDYPWNWMNAGQVQDCPVLDNGLVRIRYDASNVPGFCADVWNGATYVEQGKLTFQRIGDVTGFDTVWVAATLYEYLPDRAVLQCVLSNPNDALSLEKIFITLQRGTLGFSVECYSAPKASGSPADAIINWSPALNAGVADLNNSLLKPDNNVGSVFTTVASGSNGVNVNTFTGAGNLSVASTSGFASSGIVAVSTATGGALVSYGGTTGGNTFTACTLIGGSGTLATGNSVAPGLPSSWTPLGPNATQNSGPAPSQFVATAGTGAGAGNSGMFGGLSTLGNGNFGSAENWVALLRCPVAYNVIGPYQTTFVVMQSANCFFRYQGSDTNNYGTSDNVYSVRSQNSAGYIQAQLFFNPTQAQQIMEAESLVLGAGSSSTLDASASGGSTVVSTHNTDANPVVSQPNWPNSFLGTYRVFARVKVNAATGSFYAKTGATTGTTVTCTSTSYVWIDLGELVANNSTLEIHGWNPTASDTVSIDRIESVLVQDRARTAAIFSGARDQAQAALYDSRTLGALAAR